MKRVLLLLLTPAFLMGCKQETTQQPIPKQQQTKKRIRAKPSKRVVKKRTKPKPHRVNHQKLCAAKTTQTFRKGTWRFEQKKNHHLCIYKGGKLCYSIQTEETVTDLLTYKGNAFVLSRTERPDSIKLAPAFNCLLEVFVLTTGKLLWRKYAPAEEIGPGLKIMSGHLRVCGVKKSYGCIGNDWYTLDAGKKVDPNTIFDKK